MTGLKASTYKSKACLSLYLKAPPSSTASNLFTQAMELKEAKSDAVPDYHAPGS